MPVFLYELGKKPGNFFLRLLGDVSDCIRSFSFLTNDLHKLWVNDTLKQNSNSGNMIFNIAEQISHLSTGITLHPGDVIMTGTPAGVGAGRGEFLKAGDVVKVEIAEIGSISNTMT